MFDSEALLRFCGDQTNKLEEILKQTVCENSIVEFEIASVQAQKNARYW
jgi:hypothetical protein